MGVLVEAKALAQKYPLTFLAMGAAALLAMPVVSVSTSSALRPWARRVLSGALSLRREARRIIAESQEGYADLLAEVEQEGTGPEDQPHDARVAEVASLVDRAEARVAERAISQMA